LSPGGIVVNIFHDFFIKAPPDHVFRTVSAPEGLDRWWTKRSAGEPRPGAEFELELTHADEDWIGTRVGFRLESKSGGTQVRFYNEGWRTPNEHYRISCYCWAMYLRILRRYVEHGESMLDGRGSMHPSR
jgi:hypothetical protein